MDLKVRIVLLNEILSQKSELREYTKKGTPIPESEYSSSLGFFVSRRILTKLGGYGPWGHT